MKITRLAILFVVAAMTTVVSAQTDTTFTYQGELKENGSPANGAFDIEFELWNAATGGNRIGNEIENDELPVVNGRFTVELDFGADAFDNTDRWLEIKVNGTELVPRQPITRAPYAIQTRGIFVNDAGDVGIGTVSPNYPLHVETDDVRAITAHVSNSGPFNIGIWGSADGALATGVSGTASSVGVSGYASATSGLNAGVLAFTDSTSGRGVDATANTSIGVNYAVYGKSNSPAGFDFYAAGAGEDYGSSSSRRWKANIEAIDQPLEKISQLRGVYFDWDTEHGGQHDVGMIAEEVGSVMPEIVQYEENGVDAIGMDYSKMTPLLVEAVNALRAEKDAEIARQQVEIVNLAKRLDQMEATLIRLLEK